MNVRRHNGGFSLTEVLLALGTMAVGMVLAAGLFPAGVLFTNTAVERTIAVVAADEAFAKIRLYGIDLKNADLKSTQSIEFEKVSLHPFFADDKFYPSVTGADTGTKQYYWYAICRRTSDSDVQVTVFVCRLPGSGVRPMPMPVKVGVSSPAGSLLSVDTPMAVKEGHVIVNDADGQIYRVVGRQDPQIELDRVWEGANGNSNVWVVPPTLGGGRYPCIGVYQKVIRF